MITIEEKEPEVICDYFRSYLMQVIQVHGAMFEKLLSEDLDIPLELAEAFEDAANTYLEISETISERYRLRRSSHARQHLEARVKLAWRVVEPELLAEPGIAGAEDLAKPVENDADRQ